MTNPPNKFFGDISRLASDAMGAAQGVKKDIETMVHSQIEKMINDLDITKREESDVIKEMAQKALEQNKELLDKIATLEARIEHLEKNK